MKTQPQDLYIDTTLQPQILLSESELAIVSKPREEKIKYEVEHTDTLGGEANYSWVIRRTLELPRGISDRELVRQAKAAIGMAGIRCRKVDMGETIALYPHGCCQVVFITPRY